MGRLIWDVIVINVIVNPQIAPEQLQEIQVKVQPQLILLLGQLQEAQVKPLLLLGQQHIAQVIVRINLHSQVGFLILIPIEPPQLNIYQIG